MQKNIITNKITPCCGLPFSVIYWWVSNLTLNSESDRQFILSKISQNGTISIDGWKVLVNSGTLEADASLTKAEFLAWFDCGKQPTCEQLKLIIEGFKISNWSAFYDSVDALNLAFEELENKLKLKYNNVSEAEAVDVIQRIDQFTGENVNYRETTDINEVDGVVYVQKSNKKYKLKNIGVFNLGLFGAKQDGVSDDTEAINRAMLFSAKNGGCNFEFNTNSIIKVNGTILLPTHTKININGSTILANMQTVFSTAYLVNGSLTSNQNAIDEAVEAQLRDSGVYNGTIQNAKVGFYLKNFILGSFLRDLTFNACEQSWFCHRSFYPVFENIISLNGINTPGVFAYHFNESNNAISLKRVTSTKEYNFLFQGGTTAISIESCTSEGGAKGFVFKDECFGISINACYFEALKDVFDFSGVTNGNFNISGNYINITDRVMIAPDFPSQLYGVFDETNTIVNVGTEYNGFTYRGLMDIGKPRNMMKYSYISNIENINTLPSNWLYGEQNNVELISAAGITNSTFMGKTKNITGVIPVVRGGDVGSGYDGYVLGSTHSQIGTADNFSILVKTKIKARDVLFAKFNLYITTNSAVFNVFGDIYGNNAKQFDSTGKNATIEVEQGNIVIKVSGFNEASLNYLVRGSVQLLV